MQEPGVRVLSRRLAAHNTVLNIFFDTIEQVDGSRVDNYLVVEPIGVAENLISGVSVLPIVDDKILLVRVYRHAIHACVWEVPRGFIESNENPIDAALRELKEETGLFCESADLKSLGMMAPEGGTLAARLHLFVATKCVSQKGFSMEEFGHRELRYFDAAELATMIMRSEIEDPSTMVAYLRYVHGMWEDVQRLPVS